MLEEADKPFNIYHVPRHGGVEGGGASRRWDGDMDVKLR